MTLIIAYQFEDKVAIMTPAEGLDITDVAKKDVPTGCPYIITDPSKVDSIDFTKPDGVGSN
jgi:hypothetical protein